MFSEPAPETGVSCWSPWTAIVISSGVPAGFRSESFTSTLASFVMPRISTRNPSRPVNSSSHVPSGCPAAMHQGNSRKAVRKSSTTFTTGNLGSTGSRVGLPSPPAAIESAPPIISPAEHARYAPHSGRWVMKVTGSVNPTWQPPVFNPLTNGSSRVMTQGHERRMSPRFGSFELLPASVRCSAATCPGCNPWSMDADIAVPTVTGFFESNMNTARPPHPVLYPSSSLKAEIGVERFA